MGCGPTTASDGAAAGPGPASTIKQQLDPVTAPNMPPTAFRSCGLIRKTWPIQNLFLPVPRHVHLLTRAAHSSRFLFACLCCGDQISAIGHPIHEHLALQPFIYRTLQSFHSQTASSELG
jgi:hypothetical protein